MHKTDRIEINPKVMMGKPVIRGTRVTVELILRKLSEGASITSLLDAYPRLTREDIQAAIGYAADTLAHEETIILESKKNWLRNRLCVFICSFIRTAAFFTALRPTSNISPLYCTLQGRTIIIPKYSIVLTLSSIFNNQGLTLSCLPILSVNNEKHL